MRSVKLMAKKRSNPERNRVEFLADPEWIERVTKAADRLGFGTLSGLVRFAVTRYLDEVMPEREEEPKKGGKK